MDTHTLVYSFFFYKKQSRLIYVLFCKLLFFTLQCIVDFLSQCMEIYLIFKKWQYKISQLQYHNLTIHLLLEICFHSVLQVLHITLIMCLVLIQDRFLKKELPGKRLPAFYISIGTTKLPPSRVQFRFLLTANENLLPHQKCSNSYFLTKSFFAKSGKILNS